MGHKKLIRFEEIKGFKNVLQYPEDMKNKWKSFFPHPYPITLELACGKGEYTLGLSRLYPTRNFIGVDIKGNRIWKGAKTALEEGLENAAFLRTHIDKIEQYFAEGEVEEIWITFPDPQLRWSHMKKRLTHPKYLRKYKNILQKNGKIHLKTDSPDLFHFTMKVIEMYELPLFEHCDNVYAQESISEELQIKTYYESLDIAGKNRVHYICFGLKNDLPEELDAILKEDLRPLTDDTE